MSGFSYFVPDGLAETELVSFRSRFIGVVRQVKTPEEAKSFVQELRNKHNDATHICHAYVLGRNNDLTHSSDDGEPSGSAGMPILGAIKKSKLTNTAVAVVRYFGGIKLGKGALTRMYGKCALETLRKCKVAEMKECAIYQFSFTYNDYSKAGAYFRDHDFLMVSMDYSDVVRVEMAIPIQDVDKTFYDLHNKIGKFMNNKIRNGFFKFTK